MENIGGPVYVQGDGDISGAYLRQLFWEGFRRFSVNRELLVLNDTKVFVVRIQGVVARIPYHYAVVTEMSWPQFLRTYSAHEHDSFSWLMQALLSVGSWSEMTPYEAWQLIGWNGKVPEPEVAS